MRIFFFLLFLSALTTNLEGQPITTKDSLQALISKAGEDTNKVNLLLSLGKLIENNDPIAASGCYKQAEMLSVKKFFLPGQYRAVVGLGEAMGIQGKYDSSLHFMKMALGVARKMGDDVKVGISNLNMGIAYRDNGDFEQAFAFFIEGRRVIEKSKDEQLLARLYDAMQVLYNYRAEYDKAISYGEMALPIARKSPDKMLLARSLVNLALNYNSAGRVKDAEPLLMEALTIADNRNDKRIESAAIMNLADIALKNKDSQKLKKYSTRSLALGKEMNALSDQATALRALGVAYLIEKQFDSASYYAAEAYKIDTAYSLRKEIVETLNLLANISFARGEINDGLDYDVRVSDMLAAFVNEIISQQSATLEKKFETEKKDNQIRLQQAEIQQKKVFNYILIGGALVVLVISLLSYRNYRHKQKLQQQRIAELEKEKQLTATEAVLKGEEQERTRLAKDLHDGLGGLLSGIKYSFQTMKGNLIMTPENAQAFERSMDMLDSSIKEMRRVAHNMMPEALVKFGLDTALKDFCNDINKSGALQVTYQSIGIGDATIEQTMAITIYRIVQELLNNTIKHAAAETAIVQVSKTDAEMSITVEDDGKGFNIEILNASGGIGWSNIQSRVEYLKGKLDVQSRPGEGTSVHIELIT